MERFCYSLFDQWFKKKNRKPLILRGARQVGKSTAIREWVKSQSLNLFEINLEKYPTLDAIFSSNDVNRILKEIEILLSQGAIQENNSVLFLDEIQATPSAIAALRYFYEERPQLAVMAAGSLLEFTLAKHQYSMPVGRVEYCFLGPMTFKEFLLALEQQPLIEIMESYQWGDSYFSPHGHEKLLEYMRQYMLVGGMPEAVQHCVDYFGSESSFHLVDNVIQSQLSILETYQDDFSKYCRPHEFNYLHTVFSKIPQTIAQKVKYSNIDSEAVSRNIKNAVQLLLHANVLQAVYHTDANGIPLHAEQNTKKYKLYFLDIGLLNRASRIEWLAPEELKTRQFINEGPLAEQFIAQHLIRVRNYSEKPSLHYWLREKKQSNAEIDFVWQQNRDIIPIEVKAGKSGSLRSLQQFMLDKKLSRAYRFDANPPVVQQVAHSVTNTREEQVPIEFKLYSLPLYMVEEMPRLLFGRST